MAKGDSRHEQSSKSYSETRPEQDEELRGKVRELTSQVLKTGHVDPRGVEDVVRSVTESTATETAPSDEEARRALLEELGRLDGQLSHSAAAAHTAIEKLRSKGVDFTENDLKEAFAMLKELQRSYVETVNRLATVASGNLQRELRGLAGHAQQVGADTGARVAMLMTEFGNRLNAISRETASTGLGAARDVSVRMSLLASGVLAGIADAIQEPSANDKKE